MNLSEISQLIEIRNFLVVAVNDFNFNRETSRALAKMLILLNKRITEKLLSTEFKEFVNFEEDADKAMAEVVEHNNIKAGMNPSDGVVVMNNGKAQMSKK